MTDRPRYLRYGRFAASLFVVVAGVALSSLTLGGLTWGGAASAAYYGYCPGGAASAAYYGYCPPATTALTTSPQPVVGPTGSEFRDEATLSGGTDPTGTITFRFYGPDDLLCQNPPAFTSVVVVDHGNGTYTSGGFTPSHSQFGSYQWTANYSGDADNAPSSSPCGLEPVTVTRIPAHFKAYEVDQETPIHASELVLLTDQFGTEQVQVSGARLLLTPVEKRRQGRPAEPILREDEHLKCYVVSGGANQDRTVRVSNQFVTGSTLRVGGPTRLCAPASKSLTGPPTAPPIDTQHYKCYSAFEPSPRPEEIVDLVDQFGLQRFGVRAATLLCNPVTKQRVGRPAEPAPRPDEHLVCYTLRKLQTFSPRRVFTLDQFISQRVRVKNPLLLCVPSEKLP